MEQRLFLGERLLRDNDVASMACSLEQRVPLVDQVLHRERGSFAGSRSLPAIGPEVYAASHRSARP
jgi:hypothetical protein